MIGHQEWTPTTKITQRSGQADLLLSELRAGLRTGRAPEESAPEQLLALARIQAALEIYSSYFYPHEPHQGGAPSG